LSISRTFTASCWARLSAWKTTTGDLSIVRVEIVSVVWKLVVTGERNAWEAKPKMTSTRHPGQETRLPSDIRGTTTFFTHPENRYR
jgi:hypothetical protein